MSHCPFSLARFVKSRSKIAKRFVLRYEVAAVRLARKRGLDGVVCGHIHVPQLRTHRGVIYANCGDWIESRTALGETHAGELVLLRQGRQTTGLSTTGAPPSTRSGSAMSTTGPMPRVPVLPSAEESSSDCPEDSSKRQ